MVKIECQNIHSNCDFVVEDKNAASVMTKYAVHASEQHGIRYPLTGLMQLIIDNESKSVQLKAK